MSTIEPAVVGDDLQHPSYGITTEVRPNCSYGASPHMALKAIFDEANSIVLPTVEIWRSSKNATPEWDIQGKRSKSFQTIRHEAAANSTNSLLTNAEQNTFQ